MVKITVTITFTVTVTIMVHLYFGFTPLCGWQLVLNTQDMAYMQQWTDVSDFLYEDVVAERALDEVEETRAAVPSSDIADSIFSWGGGDDDGGSGSTSSW